jgi:hypothetical protein
MIVDRRFSGMEAVRTSETSVDNYFTRQYIPEDNSEQGMIVFSVPLCYRLSVSPYLPCVYFKRSVKLAVILRPLYLRHV